MIRSIIQYGKLSREQKYEVVDIFLEGFGHFMTFTKDRNALRTLFFRALNPVYTYAMVENEVVIGILGIGTNKVRPIKFDLELCIELFGGMKGKIMCKQLNGIFQSPVVKNDRDLYIDVLATAKPFRGKGVATRLLEHSFNLQGYTDYYIEVMSKNKNAKRLYEKKGFVEYKKKRVSPLALKGYGYPILMKKGR
ncbi:MAG: GNAT family N-acetyltransferase [bacterium]|nr:GNAT family N-acetyltransferase [bacterium]